MHWNFAAITENKKNVKKTIENFKKFTLILQSVRKCYTYISVWYEYSGCFEDFMRLWCPAFQLILLYCFCLSRHFASEICLI